MIAVECVLAKNIESVSITLGAISAPVELHYIDAQHPTLVVIDSDGDEFCVMLSERLIEQFNGPTAAAVISVIRCDRVTHYPIPMLYHADWFQPVRIH